MSTGHVDPTIKTAVLANTVFDAVLDAAAINAYYNDLGNKIDGNYDEAHPNNIASIGLYRTGSINGGMMINQRGVGSGNLIASGASAYTLDRIKSVNLGSGTTTQAYQTGVFDLNGASKGLIMNHSGSAPSAQGKLSHVYTMEALDSYKLAGQQVTFQVQVNSFQGMNQVTLNARYKTTESAISNSSTLIGTSGAVVISVGAWTLVTLTVTLPSRVTLTQTGVIGIEIIASKTTAEASGDGFIITQLDWNLGSTALPFQPRNFADELALCQRYYEKSYNIDIAPATATITGEVIGQASNAVAVSTAGSLISPCHESFKVPKRTTPTTTIYSTDGTPNAILVSGSTNRTGCTATGACHKKPFDLITISNTSATPISDRNQIQYQWTSDAEL